MSLNGILICVEVVLIVLLLAEIVVLCIFASRRRVRRAAASATQKQADVASESNPAPKVQAAPAPEPKGYASGTDAFLDRLTNSERTEFYTNFIYKSCCGLRYIPGGDNAEFFSGVFINLSSVMFVVSDSLMHKICIEYDRVRGLPVAAHL